MPKVRAVLFDLDHTLFDTDRSERMALGAVAKAAGVSRGPKVLEVYREINTHLWGEYRAGRVTSKELRVRRFHLWLERMGRDPRAAPRMAGLYLDRFSARGDLLPGAGATIRATTRFGLRIGVVTNGIDRVQRRRLRASALMDSFRTVVTSERAGFTKPDPRILDLALHRLRVRPEEALYVGDDLGVDGLAANRASVPFVWFNPAQVPKADANVTIAHQVTRLGEVVGIVRTEFRK